MELSKRKNIFPLLDLLTTVWPSSFRPASRTLAKLLVIALRRSGVRVNNSLYFWYCSSRSDSLAPGTPSRRWVVVCQDTTWLIKVATLWWWSSVMCPLRKSMLQETYMISHLFHTRTSSSTQALACSSTLSARSCNVRIGTRGPLSSCSRHVWYTLFEKKMGPLVLIFS